MKWMPDGKKLWDEIKDKKPTILSAPTEHKSSIEGKKEWLSENLPEAPYIIEQEKEKYADKGAVLIDDRESNIEKWEKAGGTGILHKNTKDTLEKLSKIMKNAAKESMEKLDIVAGMLEAEGLLKEAMHVDAIANSLQEFVENGTRQMK
jgi:5'(3')-deoxyribonucleotidase